jgi:hypothetical protein
MDQLSPPPSKIRSTIRSTMEKMRKGDARASRRTSVAVKNWIAVKGGMQNPFLLNKTSSTSPIHRYKNPIEDLGHILCTNQ